MKEKAEYEKRVLLDEDKERDEGDCPSLSRRTFFSPLLLSVSPPYALVCFFFLLWVPSYVFSFLSSPLFSFFLYAYIFIYIICILKIISLTWKNID